MNQEERNAPMTQGQFQTLRDLMYGTHRKLDNLQNDMSQTKRDINVIANELGCCPYQARLISDQKPSIIIFQSQNDLLRK